MPGQPKGVQAAGLVGEIFGEPDLIHAALLVVFWYTIVLPIQ